jgi:hypothetical protein
MKAGKSGGPFLALDAPGHGVRRWVDAAAKEIVARLEEVAPVIDE